MTLQVAVLASLVGAFLDSYIIGKQSVGKGIEGSPKKREISLECSAGALALVSDPQ